jgi:large subunit ribosomal protein L4e
MTTGKIYSIQGTELKSISLPNQFEEEVNQDLIDRAVKSILQGRRQSYGATERAGMRSSADLSRRRKRYRGGYGRGMSRVPRKVMWRRGTQFGYEGAFAPGTKGGRRSHPPKPEKDFSVKVNKKERRKAIRSAIAATAIQDLVSTRHQLPKSVPIIMEQKFESLAKTKQVQELLLKLGFEKELERLDRKKIRAGKGTSRNRKYRVKRGPLIVFSQDCPLEKASRNLQGVECTSVEKLNAELLAPGSIPGRLVIWSESAIERLDKEKLFTNTPVTEKKEKKQKKSKKKVAIKKTKPKKTEKKEVKQDG